MIEPLLLCNFVVVISSLITDSPKKTILIKLGLTTVLLSVVVIVTADTNAITYCGHMIICNSLIALGCLLRKEETRLQLLARISVTTVFMYIVGVLIDVWRGV